MTGRPHWPAWLALAALLLLAFGVRLVHLPSDPIWFDEAATIGIASMRWSVILGPMAQAESSPPGYYVLAKLWSELFGSDIVTLRLLSVLAGVAALVPVWLLARLAVGRRAAWVATAFVALAGTHVRMSQDARCYAVLFLLAALAMLAAAHMAVALRARRAPVALALGYGSLIGAMLWLHPTATLIGLALNVFAAVLVLPDPQTRWRGLAWLAANLLAAVLAATPLLAMFHHAVGAPRYSDRWLMAPGVVDSARIYGRALIAPYLNDLSPWTALLQVALMVSAALVWWRTRNAFLFALAAMLAVGGLSMPLVSQLRPVMIDRTVLFLLLPMALLLGAGTASLPRRGAVPVAALLIGLQTVGVWGWHTWPVRKEQWDLAGQVLKARLRPGEPLVLPDSAFVAISITRPLLRLGVTLPEILVVPPESPLEQLAAAQLAPDHPANVAALCAHLAGGSDTLWLVMRDQPDSVDFDRGFTMRGPVRRRLEAAGGRMLERLGVVGVELEHWTAPGC